MAQQRLLLFETFALWLCDDSRTLAWELHLAACCARVGLLEGRLNLFDVRFLKELGLAEVKLLRRDFGTGILVRGLVHVLAQHRHCLFF